MGAIRMARATAYDDAVTRERSSQIEGSHEKAGQHEEQHDAKPAACSENH